MATLIVALIVAFGAIAGPLITALVTGRQRHQEREEDWKRQDDVAVKAKQTAEQADTNAAAILERQKEVAEQAEAAAALLGKRQEEVAAQAATAAVLLLESNKQVAETANVANNKLDVIHTLVNGQMTAAMQGEYDAISRQLVLMKEVLELHRAAGEEPTEETTSAINTTEAQLADLGVSLSDRIGDSLARAEDRNGLTK